MKHRKTENNNSFWNSKSMPFIIPAVIGFIFTATTIKATKAPVEGLVQQLSIVIPEVVIWIIATVGAFRFKKYANAISDHPDGKALDLIANALLLLVVYVIMLTTTTSVVSLFVGSQYLSIAVALGNHLPLAVLLAAAVYLLRGSLLLCKAIDAYCLSRAKLVWIIGSTSIFFAIFAYAFYHTDPTTIVVNGIPRFALPLELLLVTYVLPHVAVWSMGIFAGVNLINYASNVPGVLYKRLFKNLYVGILLAFASIFAAQFLIITLMTASLPAWVLAMIYSILIFGAMGFIFILRGAQKLDKIEATL